MCHCRTYWTVKHKYATREYLESVNRHTRMTGVTSGLQRVMPIELYVRTVEDQQT